MDNIEDTAKAIGMVESGGNYHYQTGARVDGTIQRKVGAYGIIESKIGLLAEAIGIPGADWRDPAVQDKIINEHLTRSYRELDSWDLAAVAFRYGMPLARHFKQHQLLEPGDMENAGYKQAGLYVRQVRRGKPNRDMPVEGKLTSPDIAVPQDQTMGDQIPTPNRRRSEDIVRNTLTTMRNAQRQVVRNSNQTEKEPV